MIIRRFLTFLKNTTCFSIIAFKLPLVSWIAFKKLYFLLSAFGEKKSRPLTTLGKYGFIFLTPISTMTRASDDYLTSKTISTTLFWHGWLQIIKRVRNRNGLLIIVPILEIRTRGYLKKLEGGRTCKNQLLFTSKYQ